MSGTPFSVTSSGTSVNAPGNTQTADQVKPEVAILGGHGVGSPYFDPLAYRAVTDARFGTAGVISLRGPGIFNLDVGLFRQFRITERFKLDFAAEGFNITNSTLFNSPASLDITNANFGRITSQQNTPRSIQLGMKLQF